jgi:TonB family protein
MMLRIIIFLILTVFLNFSTYAQTEQVELNQLVMTYRPNTEVFYPRLSKDIGEQGIVGVQLFINENGEVRSVDVVKSSGFSRLDNAATQLASRIYFRPYLVNGVPSRVNTSISVEFQLNSGAYKADRKNNCKVFDPNPKKEEVIDFEGDCLDDFANGPGKALWHKDNILLRTLQGFFVKGKMDGVGVFQSFSEGNEYTYRGEIKSGLANGKGDKKFIDGRAESGIWLNGSLQTDNLNSNKQTKKFPPTTDSNNKDMFNMMENAKNKCIELGFKKGSETFGQCILELTK